MLTKHRILVSFIKGSCPGVLSKYLNSNTSFNLVRGSKAFSNVWVHPLFYSERKVGEQDLGTPGLKFVKVDDELGRNLRILN